jgi:hypothetical protein
MKTLRISDHTHQKLTALLGQLTAQQMKMQTYSDTIENLLGQTIILPPELLAHIEDLIKKKKHLSYKTKEEFLQDAARWRLKSLSGEYEYVKMWNDVYEKLEPAIKEMDLPFLDVNDFINQQIKSALEKYNEWKGQKEENEKTS